MKTECEEYVAEPEAHERHLETCETCRALFGGSWVEARGVRLEALPLAPWEGAAHRAWPLVFAGAALVLAAAAALFAASGISPLRGLAAAIGSAIPSLDVIQALVWRMGGALQHVPAGWQIAIGVSFVAINALLVALLRRAPKGIDV